MAKRDAPKKDNRSLLESLDAPAVAAIVALSQLQDLLLDGVPHPQEFGMGGCPACKVRESVDEAIASVQDARERLRLWSPGV